MFSPKLRLLRKIAKLKPQIFNFEQITKFEVPKNSNALKCCAVHVSPGLASITIGRASDQSLQDVTDKESSPHS